jgi:hypothetical protein
MVMNKIGLNLSVLNNLTAPNISLGGTAKEISDNIAKSANTQTNNYFGMGILVTLFFFLVWKLGRGTELLNEQFSSIRSIGIAGGVCCILGFQMLNLGYFTEIYHVVIFGGITLLTWIIVFIGNKR